MINQPIVFDVDGTLTREPYDENNLLSLQENNAMVIVALALQIERPLIISTARPEKLYYETKSWLLKHRIMPTQIYMRPDDQEGVPDALIKLEHLKDIRRIFGEPLIWVDDNVSVIDMLKQNKVPVIQVDR